MVSTARKATTKKKAQSKKCLTHRSVIVGDPNIITMSCSTYVISLNIIIMWGPTKFETLIVIKPRNITKYKRTPPYLYNKVW